MEKNPNTKEKHSFWVVRNKEVVFVEGVFKAEEEDDWCPGEIRFHDFDGYYYLYWFNTKEEAIRKEIELANDHYLVLDEILHEIDTTDEKLECIKIRNFWLNELEKEINGK